MKVLSPKKYIETKVRNLPVYKCLVNKDWRQSKMAEVIVMRKHANGNITAGMFLVDLLCLGVKDTNFFFNESEDDLTSKLKPILSFCEQIDYNTAHNIVYAGHDFAYEFDIKPHKDFAITKYILQPDDERIPLIEIPTGADDGKPFLMTDAPGQYADALLKLKKNAGEGNYYYSKGIDSEAAGDETEDNADAEFSELLDDYEEEAVTPLAVQFIADEEIKDEKKVKTRSAFEQFTINTENFYRIYKSLQPENLPPEGVMDRTEYKYLTESYKTTDIDSADNRAFISATKEIADYFKDHNSGNDDKEFFGSLLHKYQETAFVLSHLHQYFIFRKEEELKTLAISYLEKQAPKAVAILSLALGGLIENKNDPRFDFLNNDPDIIKAFPTKEKWDVFELATFWLTQTYVHVRKGDLKNAFHYYELFAETRMQNWLLPFVQVELCNKTRKVLEEIYEEKKIELEKMREAEEEGKSS